jgi:hypothetical protein
MLTQSFSGRTLNSGRRRVEPREAKVVERGRERDERGDSRQVDGSQTERERERERERKIKTVLFRERERERQERERERDMCVCVSLVSFFSSVDTLWHKHHGSTTTRRRTRERERGRTSYSPPLVSPISYM